MLFCQKKDKTSVATCVTMKKQLSLDIK
jgi:hypothetical protein